ncbi:anti-sigma factor family protein [Kordia sp.]|uniref:anti-sigma factor family protein n=1 Tax=Kordia sp. TaxID=1965332 RepID=UPI003D2A87C4
MDKEDLIQNYIANRLSEQEKTEVETLLETDLELQALYETHTEMAAAFQLSKSKAIKKRLQALDAQDTSSETQSFLQRNYNKIAIVAVLVIGVFFMINVLKSNGDLYETYFETCPNTYLPVTRGNNQKDAQFEAFKAYESNDFKTAETNFHKLLETTSSPAIKFYYAMSLLNQDKFDMALAELQLLNTKTFGYQVESLWYTALIQIKNKDIESARQHLTTIQQLNKDFKSEEIQSILDTL